MSLDLHSAVSPEVLADVLHAPDLRIIDCRFVLSAAAVTDDAGEAAWREAHIPGAAYAHLQRDLSGSSAAGAGRHPWPSVETFAVTLARLGIGPGTRVVAYDDDGGAFAARLWWLLRCFGHEQVAVLDGGWSAWCALGLPVDAHPSQPGAVPPHTWRFDERRLLRDADALQRHLTAGGLLLDARAGPRFRGEVEPLDPRAGHVPGARNRAWTDNLDGGRLLPPDVLAAAFGALLDGRPAADLAVMCGSGVTACHHLLAMAYAGLEGAKLYAPSWSGWVEDPGRPVATGPA